MPSARAWIDSRHLRESAEGAAAIDTLDVLDPSLRERLLARGDAIAAWSTSLAHAYLPVAARAAAIGSAAFDEWERALLAIAGESNVPRELAVAFFRVEPRDVCGWTAALRHEWIASVTTLAEASRRLATALVDATATLLAHGGRLDEASLRAWHGSARQLLARGGWRSEFLAEAFVGGGARLLGRLDTRAVAAWADLVAVLGTTGRNPRPPQPSPALLALDDRALAGVLHLCAGAAAREARAAQRLLDLVPHAVAALDPREAAALLDACARSTSLDALADSMTLLAGVLHGVPKASVSFLLGEAQRIADAAPAVLPAFLRTMDRALEEGGAAGVELWVTRGLELAESASEAAAVAHFRLETRTSHKLLVHKSAAVTFEEVDGMLRRYLTMMSRRSFQLVPSPGMWMRPPLAAPEDVAIRLPERVDLFDSSDDNLALYKVVATHIAGRFEYGTYDFRLDELLARGWSPPLAPLEEGPRDIIAFLGCFPNPLLASALFVLLDGVRIDASLERDFPGLRSELARIGRMYASTVVPGGMDRYDERLLDTLFQMGLAHRSAGELDARLRAQGELVAASIELLRTKDATIYDSAALTIAYYGGLAYAEARALEEGEDSPFAVEMGGATVVDPFEHLDGSDREENTAPWRPDPARAIQQNESGEIDVKLELSDDDGTPQGGGRPVSLEELKSLLERGGDLRITEMQGRIEEGLGLYITDLLGKVPAEQMKELREKIASGDAPAIRAWLARQAAGTSFWYDEWDHRIHDYRRHWCRVTEIPGDEDAGEYFADALARSGELVGRIKRDFQMLRPDQLRRVPRAEQGEEFDLNALVEAHSDRRGRRTPSDRLYVTRKPEERDVATLFLIDMSASTDEPLPGSTDEKRVIDLTKDTLAVLSQVLGEIGDSYAIYGFSGHGRDNVEIYQVKSFAERLSDKVKARLGGIAPKRSTRMGAALRHAGEKLARTTARSRHLILLSDGFPQDFDYGDDRRSNTYGIRDTLQALREIEKRGMQTFCITVDPAGHDYLGEMCPSSRYAVIENIGDLPTELVRIYRRLTRS
jgi:nitric oxide reductase NorD protein